MEQLFSAPIILFSIMSSENRHHRWSNNWNVRMMGIMIISLFSLSALLTSFPTAAAEAVGGAVDDTQATTADPTLPSTTSASFTQIPGNCSQVKCPPVESCPEDSYRLPSLVEPVRQHGGGGDRSGSTCCPHSSSSGTTQNKCQCIPDLLCPPKECPQGLVAHVSKNATGKPGGCCPKYECLPSTTLTGDTNSNHHQQQHNHHHHHYHQPQKLHGAPINFDSSLSSSIEEDGDIDDDDDDDDDDLDADDEDRISAEDLEAKPIQLGSEDDDGHCYHDGQVYKSGGSWTVQEDCSECFCEHGLVSCKPVTCDVPAECRVARAQPLSCCPVCDGCVSSSGKVYNMSEVWQEDSCTNCTCQGGRIQCHVSMCKHQHTCENPKHHPGECCPRCENEPVETKDKDSCPFRSCHRDISCPKGFRLDKAGCPTCECQKCQSLLGCKLGCTHGLKVDKFGCPACECSRGEEDEVDQLNNLLSLSSSVSGNGDEIPSKDREDQRDPSGNPSGHRHYHDDDHQDHDHDLYGYGYGSNEIKSSSSSKASSSPVEAAGSAAAPFCAVDSDGVRRLEGEEWSDHCRRCVCRNGKEMCSLITCQVPKCEHPIFYPGDCCPRCPVEETSVSFTHINVSVCLSTDGMERVEGEIWTLSSCLTCTCHSGQVFCAAPDCPPTPCSSPKLVDCCLQCPSSNEDDKDGGNKDHSVTSLKASKSNKNCLSDDSIKTYLDGDTWKVGSCQSCRCEDGQIQCFSAGKCPALECARPILAKNQCCPICLGVTVHKPAVQHVAGFEVHHGNHHDLHRHENPSLIHNGPTTTATTSRSGLEPHCAVLIACLLVVTILLSLYIVRQVCFHRRVSRRLIKKVPVGFHSSSSSSHSPSVTPDCCYKCDYSKYCDSGGGGCVIGVGAGSGAGVCGGSRSSSTNGSNGHLSSEQKPLFQNSSSHNNHRHHNHQQQLQNIHDDQHSVSSSSIPCSTPTPPTTQPVLTQSLLRDSDKV